MVVEAEAGVQLSSAPCGLGPGVGVLFGSPPQSRLHLIVSLLFTNEAQRGGRVPFVTQLLRGGGEESRAPDPKPRACPLPIIPVGCGKPTDRCGGQQGLPSNVPCRVLALR